MFTAFALSALLASTFVPAVLAEPTPLTPGPGDVFTQGGDCTFSWTADPTGVWDVMNVQLMTGDNFHMVHLTTVATLDGTSDAQSPFTFPCPEVTPNSAIYFYQFTTPASTTRTWTTRFAIADASGATTPPTERTQPGTGEAIPWGTGALVNPADARPAPPNAADPGAVGASTSVSASVVPASSSASILRTASASARPTTPTNPNFTRFDPASTPAAARTSANPLASGADVSARTVSALVVLGATMVISALFL